jgi:hypothetical protein
MQQRTPLKYKQDGGIGFFHEPKSKGKPAAGKLPS